MGAEVLTATATMMCSHGGTTTAVATNARVKCVGAPALVLPDVFTVAGCAFTVPPGTPMPCVAAQAVTASTRVKVGGKAVLTRANTIMTTGSGPPVPVTVTLAQTRVKAL